MRAVTINCKFSLPGLIIICLLVTYLNNYLVTSISQADRNIAGPRSFSTENVAAATQCYIPSKRQCGPKLRVAIAYLERYSKFEQHPSLAIV